MRLLHCVSCSECFGSGWFIKRPWNVRMMINFIIRIVDSSQESWLQIMTWILRFWLVTLKIRLSLDSGLLGIWLRTLDFQKFDSWFLTRDFMNWFDRLVLTTNITYFQLKCSKCFAWSVCGTCYQNVWLWLSVMPRKTVWALHNLLYYYKAISP